MRTPHLLPIAVAVSLALGTLAVASLGGCGWRARHAIIQARLDYEYSQAVARATDRVEVARMMAAHQKRLDALKARVAQSLADAPHYHGWRSDYAALPERSAD